MPRKNTSQSIAANQVLSRFIQWAGQAPDGAHEYPAHSLIQLMRARLGMTQAQLAKRCGLPQSHIAKIEKGKVDIQLDTLRRIFKALFCSLVVAPQAEGDLDRIIRSQARKAAMKRVGRVAGTAMEQQRPEDDMLEELIKAETEKLLLKRSSDIWDED